MLPVKIASLRQLLRKYPAFKKALEQALSSHSSIAIKELAGSLPAFLVAELLQQDPTRAWLWITPTEEDARYLQSDLEHLLGGDELIFFFPSSGNKPYATAEHIPDEYRTLQRAQILQHLNTSSFNGLLLTSAEALAERTLPPQHVLNQHLLTLKTGDSFPPEKLNLWLSEHGFEWVDFVRHPGEFTLRGGILDVFPFTGTYPVRIEFFGDDIDTIRTFDPVSQRSISHQSLVHLSPDPRFIVQQVKQYHTLLDYLPGHTRVLLSDRMAVLQAAESLYTLAQEAYSHAPDGALPPEHLYLSANTLEHVLNPYVTIDLNPLSPPTTPLSLGATPPPAFNGHIRLLQKKLEENTQAGIQTWILCDSPAQRKRLQELLAPEEEPLPPYTYHLLETPLRGGFEIPSYHLAVYTDHEIFKRFFRPSTRKRKRHRSGLSLQMLQQLKPGDFVVHIDHGIGKFAGLHRITVRGKQREVVKLLYHGDDVLYVSINALHKLHKYSGKEGHQPRLNRLGSTEWKRIKARTKKKVKDIARDLIKLYAKRKQTQGYAFSPDTIWQREMEASFPFDDTPDQAEATEAVKRDMEQPVPMDRLICGDVGFGKTEVAIRAAFKAVQDGKQVAVLVPTTLLTRQHYETFQQRLSPYPVRIAQLSRFIPPAQQKKTLQALKEGQIDIIIGTHRLVSKDVQFKDLGLLIIDEEQRFGVAVKEKLRQLRAEVDTLTLTATPIPRTLQFSLLGARDLSIINTPPPNRQPVITEIHSFNKNLIRDAIIYEVERGGQVFFVHNRVQNIEEIAQTLRLLVPGIRIQVAHGQMKPAQLEQIMLDFIDHKFDVLVSTNIIQNGLDITNANTIIINHAESFGLAELHQLRGRVGRSDRRAFCYLLTPSIHTLTREARQRLQAVEEFSDLGSGFNLALRDLDIRGAGNLLGAEQSGFIAEVGYETYHRILEEAVQELRTEEFSEVFSDTPSAISLPDPQLEISDDALLPAWYVPNDTERFLLYRRMSEIQQEEEIMAIQEELLDRFGPLPEEAQHLLTLLRMKIYARRLYLSRVQHKRQRLFLELPPQEHTFFYTHVFHPLMEATSKLPNRFVLKDIKDRVQIIIQEVPTLEQAFNLLHTLSQQVKPTEADTLLRTQK